MNMTMENGMMMAEDMAMVFFNSHHTPLYSIDWMPRGAAGYAGTCIFLIILSITLRLLLVSKAMLEARWREQAWKRRYITIDGKGPLSERIQQDPDSKVGVLTAQGVEENVRIIQEATGGVQPWRFSVDLPRAILVTIIGGIGYLLMIAVMTLNIGYYLSILAGVFIGELALGRFHNLQDYHH
jgi:solute carrier family 31 (copper transporter), member 1